MQEYKYRSLTEAAATMVLRYNGIKSASDARQKTKQDLPVLMEKLEKTAPTWPEGYVLVIDSPEKHPVAVEYLGREYAVFYGKSKHHLLEQMGAEAPADLQGDDLDLAVLEAGSNLPGHARLSHIFI